MLKRPRQTLAASHADHVAALKGQIAPELKRVDKVRALDDISPQAPRITGTEFIADIAVTTAGTGKTAFDMAQED